MDVVVRNLLRISPKRMTNPIFPPPTERAATGDVRECAFYPQGGRTSEGASKLNGPPWHAIIGGTFKEYRSKINPLAVVDPMPLSVR
jgi:hypothetical protein